MDWADYSSHCCILWWLTCSSDKIWYIFLVSWHGLKSCWDLSYSTSKIFQTFKSWSMFTRAKLLSKWEHFGITLISTLTHIALTHNCYPIFPSNKSVLRPLRLTTTLEKIPNNLFLTWGHFWVQNWSHIDIISLGQSKEDPALWRRCCAYRSDWDWDWDGGFHRVGYLILLSVLHQWGLSAEALASCLVLPPYRATWFVSDTLNLSGVEWPREAAADQQERGQLSHHTAVGQI